MRIACLDVGSTFTKGCLVDARTGELLATGAHRTTVDTDVLHGVDALLDQLGPVDEVRACSSAGGGLRLAVVGYERAVTAEAGRLVGLTAGARIVHLSAGGVDTDDLRATRPDLILLVGGTDGGDSANLLANAAALRTAALGVPIVVAGNAHARDDALALLDSEPATGTSNVLPRIGALRPEPARVAVREAFLRHVIGGKHLSADARFARLVRGATPDLVLTGARVLAEVVGGDVLVLDIGGATTDVYSAVTRHDEPGVAGVLPLSRTVEGDLGVRWNAPGILDAARTERLDSTGSADSADSADLQMAAARRAHDPGFLADTDTECAADDRLAALAAVIALRRHARPSTSDGVLRPGRDLRTVRLAVGSGGVLRHADPARADAVLDTALRDTAGGWLLPEGAARTIDRSSVLGAAGLLATDHAGAADGLLRRQLLPR